MNLSAHFTLDEFTRSAKAQQLGLDNAPPPEALERLRATAAMLERVRAQLSAPITVSSGYRSPAVNRAVGGTPTSDHLAGCAADIVMPGYGTPYQVARALAPHISVLGIGQIIYECLGGARWVHVSTRLPAKPVNRVITICAAGTLLGIQPQAGDA